MFSLRFIADGQQQSKVDRDCMHLAWKVYKCMKDTNRYNEGGNNQPGGFEVNVRLLSQHQGNVLRKPIQTWNQNIQLQTKVSILLESWYN